MDRYDNDEAKLKRQVAAARIERDKQAEALAQAQRTLKKFKDNLRSTTNSEQWHRMRLAWLDRDAGYAGEMASARVWLRHQPIETYLSLIAPFVPEAMEATNLQIEVAAVRANLADWNEKGEALLLDRAKSEYAAEQAEFARWQRENPDNDAWRKKPATNAQYYLIGRSCDRLDIDPPAKMKRGEAFDWLAKHGGNLRLGDNSVMQQASSLDDGEMPGVHAGNAS